MPNQGKKKHRATPYRYMLWQQPIQARDSESRQTVSIKKAARGIALFWCLFFGISGIPSVIMLWFFADAVGMHSLLAPLQQLPAFGNLFYAPLGGWFIPGLALLCIITLPNLIGAWSLICKHPNAEKLSALLGIILILWTGFEMLPFVWGFNILSGIYMVFGIAQLITGLIASHHGEDPQPPQEL
jgi:hypothetical protein